ncbi:MAG: outer membrane protein transport protein [Planctomycetota bacterium]|nr:outer membrane protein transport protein [Planctomycetota bacterium]
MILLSVAYAGAYELVYQDVESAGMGHAGVSATTSPWRNPAGLVGEGAVASTDGFGIRSQVRAQALQTAYDAPWEASTENPLALAPSLGFSVGGMAWSAGLVANVPFAGGLRWPSDWPRRFEVVSSSTRVYRLSPFVGAQRGPLAVAAGPHVDVATLSVEKATHHVSEEGAVALQLAGRGLGVDLALHLDLDTVDLGLVVRSRSRVGLAGLADFDVPPEFAASYPDQTVSSELTLPDLVVLGVGWRHLRMDLARTSWSVNQQLVFDFESSEDLVQHNRWSNSWALRVGGEQPLGPLQVRGGLYVDGLTGAPVPAETLSPASPDSERIGLTLGVGGSIVDRVSVDASIEHLRLLQRSSESPDAAEAAYFGSAWVVGLGVQIR